MKDQEVFLSWAGEQSREVVEQFDLLFKAVFDPSIKCFFSRKDIGGGERTIDKLFNELEKCNFGICFVNSENVKEPWIQFEAGAISKKTNKSKVLALLLDEKCEDELVKTPIGNFNYLKYSKESIYEIFKIIIDEFDLSEYIGSFMKRLDNYWAGFNESCEKILSERKTKESQEDESKKDPYKEDLNIIKSTLLDVRKELMSGHVHNGTDISKLIDEIKAMLMDVKPEQLREMQQQFKIQIYEKLIMQIIDWIENIIDDINTNEEDNENSVALSGVIEKLNKILEKIKSSICD